MPKLIIFKEGKMLIRFLSFIMFSVCLCDVSIAATFAYIFDKTKIHKLDVSASKAVSSNLIPIAPAFGYVDRVIYVDSVNKTLFILSGGPNVRVRAYDLQKLTLKKEFSLLSSFKDGDFPLVIVPTGGDRFYVKWVQGDEPEVTAAFDKQSLNQIENVSGFPSAYEYLGYSKDGKRIITIDINTPANIKLFDSVTYNLIEKVSIDDIFFNPNTNRGVADFSGQFVLITEDALVNSSDPNNKDILYSYDVLNKKASAKIQTGLRGIEYGITPDGKLIILNEAKYAPEESHFIVTKLGKIHVYDTQTGQKKGVVTVTDDNYCKMLGISPDSTKAYFVTKVPTKNEYKITIVDLIQLTVAAELSGIQGREIIFFEE